VEQELVSLVKGSAQWNELKLNTSRLPIHLHQHLSEQAKSTPATRHVFKFPRRIQEAQTALDQRHRLILATVIDSI
jgi:hypothetical protein